MGEPQQVRKVTAAVEEHDIAAMVCENIVSQGRAQQAARETGAEYGGVLSIDSLTRPDGVVPTYPDPLRETTGPILLGLTGEDPS